MVDKVGRVCLFSGLAELCEKLVQSARLLRSAAVLLASCRMLWASPEHNHYQRINDEGRSQLDEAAFVAAWAAGQAIGVDEVIALALG